jgi:hypothetical protein
MGGHYQNYARKFGTRHEDGWYDLYERNYNQKEKKITWTYYNGLDPPKSEEISDHLVGKARLNQGEEVNDALCMVIYEQVENHEQSNDRFGNGFSWGKFSDGPSNWVSVIGRIHATHIVSVIGSLW